MSSRISAKRKYIRNGRALVVSSVSRLFILCRPESRWYFTSMFERVYQEKRPVFDLSGQCFSRECSNEKLMYRSHLPLGSDLCRADAHHRNDSIIHRFRRLGKPTSRREQPRSQPFVRRLREMFEDSCEKCSNFRVMYHTVVHYLNVRTSLSGKTRLRSNIQVQIFT